jgi:hypothetical protein
MLVIISGENGGTWREERGDVRARLAGGSCVRPTSFAIIWSVLAPQREIQIFSNIFKRLVTSEKNKNICSASKSLEFAHAQMLSKI